MSNKNGVVIKFIIIVAVLLMILVGAVHWFIAELSPENIAYNPAPEPKLATPLVITSPKTAQPISNKIKAASELKEKPLHRLNPAEVQPIDPYVAHNWTPVAPTPKQLKLCSDMQLEPIIYTNDAGKPQLDFFDIKIYTLQNAQQYPLEKWFSKDTIKYIYDTLEKNLIPVYQQYITWFGAELLSKSHITIILTANRAQYEQTLIALDAADSINSLGVYLPSQHTAYVNIPFSGGKLDWHSFTSTLIHEATHAINFVQFGYMHRWAQEGLAEYFEYLAMSQTPELAMTSEQWDLRTEQLGEPFYLPDLIFENEKWSENKAQLYASSLAYVQFFSRLEGNNNPFVHYLKEEMLPRCSYNDKQSSLDMLNPEGLLDSNMYEWFNTNVIHSSQRQQELKAKKNSK